MSRVTQWTPGIVLAFAIVYLVWGSTYFANIVAIETIPPFVLVVSRLSVAGLLLLAFSRWRLRAKSEWKWPSRRQWRNLTVTSFLFLTIGLGAVVWAEQYIDSGMTALFVAAEPLMVVLVLWGFERKRPRWQAFAGIALGVIGTIVLVGQDIVLEGEGALWGILAIVSAITAWAFGSVLTSRVELPEDQYQTAGLQMLLAGITSIPFMLFDTDWSAFELSAISGRSIWAWVFLVFFGSVLAYSAFLYLLRRVSPEKVASSTYVHPVVALTLGAFLGAEQITQQTLLACVILLTGVLFVNGNWGRRRDSALVQPRQANAPALIRTWSGRPLPGREGDLGQFIEEIVLPDMRAARGNLAVQYIKPAEKTSTAEHLIESSWSDEESLQEFLGKPIHTPKYYQGEESFIDQESQQVKHRSLRS